MLGLRQLLGSGLDESANQYGVGKSNAVPWCAECHCPSVKRTCGWFMCPWEDPMSPLRFGRRSG
jgi:hypothetical protein